MKNPTLDSYPKGTPLPIDPCGRIPWTLRQFFRASRGMLYTNPGHAISGAVSNYGGTPANAARLYQQAKEDDLKELRKTNPFAVECGITCDATDMLAMVKGFDAEQCQTALKLRVLQKTVRAGLERRLRAIAKAERKTA